MSWKLELSAQKSECSFFTTNTNEARWRPALCLSRQIKNNLNQKFLGITYDRQLTFGMHVYIVGCKMKKQAGAVRCLASTDCGYEKSILRLIYIATGRSTVKYASAAWQPWASTISMMEKLEISQRNAGKAITGQIKTTPVKAILAEADFPTVATRATQLSTIVMEKSLLMPDTNPRMQIATAEVRQSTKKTS